MITERKDNEGRIKILQEPGLGLTSFLDNLLP